MKNRSVLSNRMVYTIASCLILAFLFTGCTTTKPKFSGWMETDYTKLKEDPDFEGSMVWIESEGALGKYNKVMVDNVAIYIDPAIEDNREYVDTEVIKRITEYFKASLIKELSKGYTVVSEPGKDVLRLRTAITAVELNKKDLKARNFIPVALVLTAAAEATGLRDRVALINMEGVAIDSLTGKTLAMVVQRKALETSVQTAEQLTAKDVYPTLDYWAKKTKAKFDRIHSK